MRSMRTQLPARQSRRICRRNLVRMRPAHPLSPPLEMRGLLLDDCRSRRRSAERAAYTYESGRAALLYRSDGIVQARHSADRNRTNRLGPYSSQGRFTSCFLCRPWLQSHCIAQNICVLPHDICGDIEATPEKYFYVSRCAFVDFGISNRIDVHAEAFLSIFRP